MRQREFLSVLTAIVLLGAVAPQAGAQTPMGTVFTYQGRLTDGGVAVTGVYEFEFRLYDAVADPSSQVGGTVSLRSVQVTNGLFTVQLDFGTEAFEGEARWLEIRVRPSGVTDPHTVLAPRQTVTAAPYALYALNSPGGASGLWAANGDDIHNTNSGKVGVGTSSPNFSLEVYDSGSSNASPTTLGVHWVQPALPESLHDWFYFAVGGSLPTVGSGTRLIRESGTDLHFQTKDEIDSGTPSTQMVLTASGKLGIGTMSPAGLLHLSSSGGIDLVVDADTDNAGGENQNARMVLKQDGGQVVGRIGYRSALNKLEIMQEYNDSLILGTNNTDRITIAGNGNIGIGTSSPAAKLDVAGTARVQVLEILGADVAEKFPTREQVEPGMVMAIDAEHPGELCLSREAYNRRVAGVVSGAGELPVGAVLGHLPGNEDAPPIALTGRVYVWADASNGPITPGDLLTTSATPGYAMKATDPSRSYGATIGKAMTSLEKGRGLVLVLVNLQ